MTATKQPKPDSIFVQQARALDELFALLERKAKKLRVPNPLASRRGTLCTQVLGTERGRLLFIYEAGYRASIYPRMVYEIPGACGDGHLDAIKTAIRVERTLKGTLAGRVDCRPAVEVPWGPPRELERWSSADHSIGREIPSFALGLSRRCQAGWLFENGQDAEATRLRAQSVGLLREPQ